jgi:hypothetical protein
MRVQFYLTKRPGVPEDWSCDDKGLSLAELLICILYKEHKFDHLPKLPNQWRGSFFDSVDCYIEPIITDHLKEAWAGTSQPFAAYTNFGGKIIQSLPEKKKASKKKDAPKMDDEVAGKHRNVAEKDTDVTEKDGEKGKAMEEDIQGDEAEVGKESNFEKAFAQGRIAPMIQNRRKLIRRNLLQKLCDSKVDWYDSNAKRIKKRVPMYPQPYAQGVSTLEEMDYIGFGANIKALVALVQANQQSLLQSVVHHNRVSCKKSVLPVFSFFSQLLYHTKMCTDFI